MSFYEQFRQLFLISEPSLSKHFFSSKLEFLFSVLGSMVSKNICKLRHKLKNSKNVPELTWSWQNKPWYKQKCLGHNLIGWYGEQFKCTFFSTMGLYVKKKYSVGFSWIKFLIWKTGYFSHQQPRLIWFTVIFQIIFLCGLMGTPLVSWEVPLDSEWEFETVIVP